MVVSSIKREYLTEEVAKDLLAFSASILAKLNASYFGYDRIFNDGTCVRLTTSPRAVKALLEEHHPITNKIPKSQLNQAKITYFISEESDELDVPKFKDFCKRFDWGSGVEFIERGQGYYDQFWFMSRRGIHQSANVFFSQQADIDEFITRVKAKYADLLQEAAKNRILLPKAVLSNLRGYSAQDVTDEVSKKLSSSRQGRNSKVKLTGRELECVALISTGLTAMEIGEFLDLSVRTVEHYIDRIKDKLGCEKKGQIAAFALKIQKDPAIRLQIQNTISRYLFKSEQET